MQPSSLQNLAGFRCSQLAAQKMLKCQATITGQQQAAAHQPCLPPPPLPPLPAAARRRCCYRLSIAALGLTGVAPPRGGHGGNKMQICTTGQGAYVA